MRWDTNNFTVERDALEKLDRLMIRKARGGESCVNELVAISQSFFKHCRFMPSPDEDSYMTTES